MSVKEKYLHQLDRRILKLTDLERSSKPRSKILWYRVSRWSYMLYYEIEKNDVAIRAESLSYFTLFSIMPLMAGIFLLLGFFSQWGPIQKEFEALLINALQAIPEEQRDTLLEFILQFKDQYLAKLSAKSTSIGIFAIGVMIWIGAKVFFNIEALMNRIWAVKENRPFFDRIQNFVFCVVILPLSYSVALSLPGLIEHFGQKRVGVFVGQGIPALIGFFSLSFIFRYFPNTKVAWKSAHIGAFASAIGFWIGNFLLRFYFRMGTETAYGKAAALPVFAFFIYVSWFIFILGVEVCLLYQNGDRYTGKRLPKTTLAQALLLEKILLLLNEQFEKASSAENAAFFASKIGVSQSEIEPVLEFLVRKKAIIGTLDESDAKMKGITYILAHSINEKGLLLLIKEYLDLDSLQQNFDVFRLISSINQLKK